METLADQLVVLLVQLWNLNILTGGRSVLMQYMNPAGFYRCVQLLMFSVRMSLSLFQCQSLSSLLTWLAVIGVL